MLFVQEVLLEIKDKTGARKGAKYSKLLDYNTIVSEILSIFYVYPSVLLFLLLFGTNNIC